jgi:outer membrane immunogenic protein
LAVGHVKFSDYVYYDASGTFNAASSSSTKAGWTVGGGVEWAFAPQWSVKAEYLYVDLGSVSYTSADSNPGVFPLATIVHDHSFTENIARLGVNYRF